MSNPSTLNSRPWAITRRCFSLTASERADSGSRALGRDS